MALCPSVTSLAVALASQSVTAAVSVPAVARFGAVCPPVAAIAGCSRTSTHVIFKDVSSQTKSVAGSCNYIPNTLPLNL